MNSSRERNQRAYRELRQYESKSILKSKYGNIHKGGTATSAKLSSIALTMRQGREFLESASNSDYLTRPIEQYYGISAYGRGQTLLYKSNLAEANLKQTHGLKIDSWERSITNSSEFLGLKIKITDGFFHQWSEIAQEDFVTRTNSTQPSLKVSYDVPEIGESITIRDLLSLIPEIWTELTQITAKQYPKLQYNSTESQAARGIWRLDCKTDIPSVQNCFPGVEPSKITHLNNYNWTIDASAYRDFIPQIVQLNEDGFNIGSTIIVPPTNQDLRLSPQAVYYITAFAFSMLARYRPSIWGAVWNLGSVDEVYPVVQTAMDIIQAWYPYILAENLRAS